MIPPTVEQARALDAIRKLTRNGVPPTYEDLRQELGLGSTSGVHRTLSALRDRGHIDFEPGRARSIRLVHEIPGLESWPNEALVALRERATAILANRCCL